MQVVADLWTGPVAPHQHPTQRRPDAAVPPRLEHRRL